MFRAIDRNEFLESQSRRFAISHLIRDRRNNFDELLDAIEQETQTELASGEIDPDVISERVIARIKERRGEFGGIITTLVISVVTQLIIAYIKKLIDNWIPTLVDS